ncbi:hypothetical protein QBC35DRAFT_251496 [Podospora australis]|uniref:Uncharacterized protein n=1 Tax=Podospora australis TaxID=1536484 RepID=A0AAN6WS07_9PEZI|nr:hypothetical protein QBC35DRAFT_251496 [Podospora australis]
MFTEHHVHSKIRINMGSPCDVEMGISIEEYLSRPEPVTIVRDDMNVSLPIRSSPTSQPGADGSEDMAVSSDRNAAESMLNLCGAELSEDQILRTEAAQKAARSVLAEVDRKIVIAAQQAVDLSMSTLLPFPNLRKIHTVNQRINALEKENGELKAEIKEMKRNHQTEIADIKAAIRQIKHQLHQQCQGEFEDRKAKRRRGNPKEDGENAAAPVSTSPPTSTDDAAADALAQILLTGAAVATQTASSSSSLADHAFVTYNLNSLSKQRDVDMGEGDEQCDIASGGATI